MFKLKIPAIVLMLTLSTGISGCSNSVSQSDLNSRIQAVHSLSKGKDIFNGVIKHRSIQIPQTELPNGYTVPIFWTSALGIKKIPYTSNNFIIVDAWEGVINNSKFNLLVYKSSQPMYGNPPMTTYIIGVVKNGIPIGGLAFHSPIWWVKFTGDTVVLAARYQIQGGKISPIRYYAINLLTGKITSSQPEIFKLFGEISGIPKWVKGLSNQYSSSIPNQKYQ